MPPRELIEYIQYELQRGTPQEKIVSDLISARWGQEQINTALAALGLVQSSTPIHDQDLKGTFTPIKLLFYAIIMCFLAYGACSFGAGPYFSSTSIWLTIGSILNLGAAGTAIVAIIRAFTYRPKLSWWARVAIVLLSLVVVAWGGLWGILGLGNY